MPSVVDSAGVQLANAFAHRVTVPLHVYVNKQTREVYRTFDIASARAAILCAAEPHA